ncbi:hypothetical protein BD414DRAFT_78339 [Trametes punicea]|nr:hypothetical protein BD414DRAFT_78339 [Trametes punicea]
MIPNGACDASPGWVSRAPVALASRVSFKARRALRCPPSGACVHPMSPWGIADASCQHVRFLRMQVVNSTLVSPGKPMHSPMLSVEDTRFNVELTTLRATWLGSETKLCNIQCVNVESQIDTSEQTHTLGRRMNSREGTRSILVLVSLYAVYVAPRRRELDTCGWLNAKMDSTRLGYL